MSRSSNPPLSVAELCELPNDSWVNDGFTAIVRAIEKKSKKAGGFFWKLKLGDTTGSAIVGCAMFTAPKFDEGQQVDFLGSGIKFKNGQYGPEVTVGDKTEIHVVGTAVRHDGQAPTTDKQAISEGSMVPGQLVGNAMSNGHEVMRYAYSKEAIVAMLQDGSYWKRLWKIASAHIVTSQKLESGNLAMEGAATARAASPAPAPAARTTQPTAAQMANQTDGVDEDVPF